MRRARSITWLALPVALVLAAAGCGSGGDTNSAGSGGESGTVSIYGTEPKATLLPANTTELGGNKAVSALYVGLLAYRPEDAKPYNLMADSIKTSDAKVFDITIKKGWKFHDGSEVKAKNYVDAWNYGAYAPNAQQAASFFENIQGYADVNPPKEGDKPTAQTMSGLKVLGDYEFQVTLNAPFSVFQTKLGFSAFYPLPDAFFKDPKGFADKPIGNGPMKFVSRTPNADIKLTRFDDYQGENKVHFKDLDIKIYSSQEAAYSDLLAGNLDFMEALPPNAKVADKYKADLGDHVLTTHLLGISTIAIPYYVPGYNNLDLRKAISLAIDRDKITKTVLNGSYVPADGWISSGIEGYQPDVCGEWCKFDPAKAKDYFQKSGFTGKLTIASNADGGRKEPLEAACASIAQTLGVSCEFVPSTNFGAFRQLADSHQFTGMSRMDWSADYPSIEDFLTPIYRTGGSSNDSLYSNPEFDKLLAQADATADKDAAIKIYQQAHALLAKDLPSVPVWDEKGIGGFSKNLKAAKLNFQRQAEISEFRL
ncbi:ABC transporter substrate-binding protein [Solihabitans fulvus]|uniref:ABC transporter substrate-binding protein n=1 Tax=Solihabitans fulvus TaxID=1892852 RepID=A0A5B2WVD4_9PSEU|nr:ABC transporter substrate-binding protein [Solihabitans fulvus]KAA2255661.1 ABC transporter substrate-binding protein [Solihabitans fulvus]